MKLSAQLKLIADGIYQVTGELIKKESVAHIPEAVRLLYHLAEEISEHEKPATIKKSPTLEERRRKNREEGKPRNSHLPWDDVEKSRLELAFKNGKTIEELSRKHERSLLAIASQLHKLQLIDEKEMDTY